MMICGFSSPLKRWRCYAFGIVQIRFWLKTRGHGAIFGVPAATVTAHRRLIKNLQICCNPALFYRYGDVRNPQYKVLIEPIVENMPSENELR